MSVIKTSHRSSIDRDEIREVLFLFANSILERKSAVYVAGPLDSGRLYFETLAGTDQPTPEIRHTNEDRLTAFAQQLRTKLGRPVIDPGLLRVPSWSGQEYGQFFIEIISRYVSEVWFLNGWEFSHGATKEFAYCTQIGLNCYDEIGQPLSTKKGIQLIGRAVEDVEALRLDASKLRSRLTLL